MNAYCTFVYELRVHLYNAPCVELLMTVHHLRNINFLLEYQSATRIGLSAQLHYKVACIKFWIVSCIHVYVTECIMHLTSISVMQFRTN